MDKRFFKNWVLHIPRCLRDLLWMVRAWSSIASSSLLMSQASSSSQSQLKVITSFWHTFFTWMNPTILGDHSRWLSPLLHFFASSSTISRCSAFWIFTFFNCFLKSIFWFMFLSSNRLIKESNIFSVFRDNTCGTSWSVIESIMIFLALTKFFLEPLYSLKCPIHFLQRDQILPCLEVVKFTKLIIKPMW